MKLSTCLPLVVSLISLSAHGARENHADRYMQSYKNYEAAHCPIVDDNIKHFVYFARDRNSLVNHPLLTHERFDGAQIMYPWTLLEPEKDQYDFSMIQEDLDYLARHEKTLFIQLQDATFDPDFRGVPDYLGDAKYGGGSVPRMNEHGKQDGWTARRWDPAVQARFAKLIDKLGEAFDGKIEGINLQESATATTPDIDPSFNEVKFVDGIKSNMKALGRAFPQSTTMQYANFMPGEWLPWDDKGYLRALYEYGEEIGVGLGAPDLMVRRRAQLNHALAMMHESEFSVPLGIAIQDGNYIGQTDSHTVIEQRENIVPLLHAFADQFLNVDYMFWVNQAPYFEEDVLTCFEPQEKDIQEKDIDELSKPDNMTPEAA